MRFAFCLEKIKDAWDLFRRATTIFFEIDGDQRAGAFAFYAFFSLFPLILVFVTAASLFVNRNRAAGQIIAYAKTFAPLTGAMKQNVFNIVSGVANARGQAGLAGLFVLFVVALSFFSVLIRAVNRAWHCEVYSWWRMPIKSALLLAVMGSTVALGICLPILTEIARRLFLPNGSGLGWIFRVISFLVPLLVLFYGLSLFYKLAPRRHTRFGEVWHAAVIVTLLLRLLETLFLIYLSDFSRFNAIYGALGGVMALLMWIWLSGCLVVFGACLCAAGAQLSEAPSGDGAGI